MARGPKAKPEDHPANGAAQAPKRGRGRPPKVREAIPNGPTPEQEAETLAELFRLDTEGARIAQAKSTCLNRFEKWGGNKKQIKAVKVLLTLDKREASASLDALLRYARNAEIEISWEPSGQATLVDNLGPKQPAPPKNTKGTRDLAAARAHADGFNSGTRGAQPHDNPFAHKPGSEEYVAWHDGRDEGARGALEKNVGLSDRVAEAKVADATMPEPAAAEAPPPF